MNVVLPHPHEDLAGYLGRDFTPPEVLANPEDYFVGVPESIDGVVAAERWQQPENQQLGREVLSLLNGASITSGFRRYIVSEVRHAHAEQRPVSDLVAPDLLELGTTRGIFNPVEAPYIEFEAIHKRAYEIATTYTVPQLDERGVRLVTPLDRQDGFKAAKAKLQDWKAEYSAQHANDPFRGVSVDDYIASAIRTKEAYPDFETQ